MRVVLRCNKIRFLLNGLPSGESRCLILLFEYPHTLFFVKTAYLIAHNQISAAVKNNSVLVNYISCGKQGVKVIRVYIIKLQFRDILRHINNYGQLLFAVYPSVRYRASVSGNNFAFSAFITDYTARTECSRPRLPFRGCSEGIPC